MPPILLDWFDVQQQTSTLRTVHLGQKNVATFTEKVVRKNIYSAESKELRIIF